MNDLEIFLEPIRSKLDKIRNPLLRKALLCVVIVAMLPLLLCAFADVMVIAVWDAWKGRRGRDE